MRYHTSIILWVVISAVTLSCSRKVNPENSENNNMKNGTVASGSQSTVGPPVYIYKTRNDYYDKVPVTLSDQKDEVVNFPDPRDVFNGEDYTYPTELESGYLLDNRGINENTAFLNITYEEYNSLPTVPNTDELYGMILDKDPFTELYYCGKRYDYPDIVAELNKRIIENKLDTFKRLR